MSVDRRALLASLGLEAVNPGACAGPRAWRGSGPLLESRNPADESSIAAVATAGSPDIDAVLDAAAAAAHAWREVPAPKRGEAVRRFGLLLREHKDALGTLVSLENGKIKAEGDGEVQEMIDIADFAVGQSRMLYGKTMHSERPAAPDVRAVASARRRRRHHRVQLPGRGLGVERPARCGVRQRDRLEAVAEDAARRARGAEALQSGSSTSWRCRRSSRCSSTRNATRRRDSPPIRGSRSCRSPVRRRSAARSRTSVAARFGKCLLECAGNNAIIVAEDADLDLVVPRSCSARSAPRGSAARRRAGSSCTNRSRPSWCAGSRAAYAQVRIGDPVEPATLMGPLIDAAAVAGYRRAVEEALAAGGRARLRRQGPDRPRLLRRADDRPRRATMTGRSCSAKRSRRSCT